MCLQIQMAQGQIARIAATSIHLTGSCVRAIIAKGAIKAGIIPQTPSTLGPTCRQLEPSFARGASSLHRVVVYYGNHHNGAECQHDEYAQHHWAQFVIEEPVLRHRHIH